MGDPELDRPGDVEERPESLEEKYEFPVTCPHCKTEFYVRLTFALQTSRTICPKCRQIYRFHPDELARILDAIRKLAKTLHDIWEE